MKTKGALSRRKFLQVTGSVTAASLLSGCSLFSDNNTSPNILFIAVDDLRPELGCYGQNHVVSPNIDRLAKSGMTFNRAYCQSAVCNPSRASLLTGKRPDTIQVLDLRDKLRDNVHDVVTLPQYFKNNGYYTVGMGKLYHNTIPDPPSWDEKPNIGDFPFDPDAVYFNEDNLDIIEEKKRKAIKAGRQARHIDRIGKWYLKAKATENGDVPDNAYPDGYMTDMAIKKLGTLKEKDQPFFFGIGFYRPHLPFTAPKKYWDLYDRNEIPLAENDFPAEDSPLMGINNLRELRGYTDFKHIKHPKDGKLTEDEIRLLKHGYLASVSYIDAQVGRLIDELDRLHLRENTLVVLWGDHGWKLGEHNSWCKMTNYEIDTRVPMIFSGPGIKAKGSTSQALVEFVDIYPTLCEMSNLEIPSDLEGTSMVPLFKRPDRFWKTAVFSQFLREGIWKAPDGREYMGYTVRTDRYRYIEWFIRGTKELAACELYDHKNDPKENINIADHPDSECILKEMRKKLKEGWKAAVP